MEKNARHFIIKEKSGRGVKGLAVRAVALVLSLSLTLICSSCTLVSREDCRTHMGETKCVLCGLVYFDELTEIIKSKANDVSDDKYSVTAETPNMEAVIVYYDTDKAVRCMLTYMDEGVPFVSFVMTMKPTTGRSYGWTMATIGVEEDTGELGIYKSVSGIFDAEELTGEIYRPKIEDSPFTDGEFEAISYYYETSLSFCVDMIYSIIKGNEKGLTISNLGFSNYTPLV